MRCTTEVLQVRFHGSREGVFVGHRPPRDPGDPLQNIEVLHLFRWYTHTPRHSGADEMKMKMKWKWKWNERYLTRTRRGERKRRGKEQTPTRHITTHLGPKRAKTLKRQGKRKSEGRRTRNQTSGGGGGRKRLNQPNKAKPKPTSARAGPNLPEGRRTQKHMRKGTHGELVRLIEWCIHNWHASFPSTRLYGPRHSRHNPIDGYHVFNPWITCTIWTSPTTIKRKEEPYLQGCPVTCECHVKWLRSSLLSSSKRNDCWRGFQTMQIHQNKRWCQSTAAQLFNTHFDDRQCETRKKRLAVHFT